jgi:hypothetical protein
MDHCELIDDVIMNPKDGNLSRRVINEDRSWVFVAIPLIVDQYVLVNKRIEEGYSIF